MKTFRNSIGRRAWQALAVLLSVGFATTATATPPLVLGYYSPDQPKCFESLTNYGPALNAVSVDAFLLGEKGAVKGEAPQKVLDFAREKKLPLYACVSNENWDPKIAHQSITTHEAALVASLLKLASANKFAGVNIDFEGLDPADRAAFSQFIQALAKSLHEQKLQLIISVPAKSADDLKDSWTGAFDYAALGQAADLIQVMTYDETVSGWDPGPVAGLDWMTQSIRYAASQIPPAKLLLGVPAYGRDWNLKTKQATDVFWTDIPSLINTHHATPTWDATSASLSFDYTAAGDNHRVWCENERGIQLKCALVKKFDLAGVSFWSLGMENAEFRQAIGKGMQ